MTELDPALAVECIRRLRGDRAKPISVIALKTALVDSDTWEEFLASLVASSLGEPF